MTDIILKWNNEQFSLFHSDDFVVQNIENLTWAQNDLSLTTNPYLAGDTVQNNVGGARDITVTLKPTKDKGDYNDLIHKLARIHGKEVSLVWKNRVIPSFFYYMGDEHTDEHLVAPLETDLTISGVVNEFESQRFDDGVIITFNVHCSNPYWTSTEAQGGGASGNEAGTINNYSEMPTGLKIEIPNFSFANNTDDYDISIFYGEAGDYEYQYDIEFYPLAGYTNASSTVKFFATFEKGKVSLKRGTDEASADDMSTKIGWKVLRAELSGTSYTAVEVTEFPQMPLSVAQEQLTFFVYHLGASAGTETTAYLSHYPMFI